MTLTTYIQSIKNKRVTVIGAGISNRPLIKLLCENGIDLTVCDRSETLHEELLGLSFKTYLGEDYLAHLDADLIFRTPGLHPDVPALKAAREKGAEITSEMELFLKLCPCRVIAVTGSDGKTTTTSLIAALLKAAGYTVHLGGNIGHPLLSEVSDMTKAEIAVLELSSFQLHSMFCCPDVAVVTNISPNHLDVHPSYHDYIDAKKQVFVNQGENAVLVVNEDNELSAACSCEANGTVRSFSRRHSVTNGYYCNAQGQILRASLGQETVLLNASELSLPGLHNLENFLAAFSAVEGLVPDDKLIETAKTFPGVPHRLEKIRVHEGVTYINDSIASSPGRTIAGLASFDHKVILIAGGKDKGLSFDDLGPHLCNKVKSMYLTGPTAEKICQAALNAPNYRPGEPDIHIFESFAEAVTGAAHEARAGDTVLLSPASTSFDRFKNFEERGNAFRKIVEGL